MQEAGRELGWGPSPSRSERLLGPHFLAPNSLHPGRVSLNPGYHDFRPPPRKSGELPCLSLPPLCSLLPSAPSPAG